MEKVYYLPCGISKSEVVCFFETLFESCISFEYDYEAGTITLPYASECDEETVNEFIRMNDSEISENPID